MVAAAGVDRPVRLGVEVITEAAKFRSLEKPWNALVRQCPHAHLFHRHEWHRVWWDHLSKGYQLFVLLVKEQGDLVGIAPLMRTRTTFLRAFPVRRLDVIANYEPCRDNLIVLKQPEAVMDGVFSHLAESGDWDILVLHTRDDGLPSAAMLPALCNRYGFGIADLSISTSPYIELDPAWAGFYQRFGSKFRTNIKSREKRLAEKGPVAYEAYSQSDNLDALIERIMAVSRKGWAQEKGTGIGSTPELHRYYSSLAKLANEKGWLYFHLLTAGGEDVAFEYNLLYEGVVYNLKIGFDSDLNKASPGKVLKRYVLEDAIGRGVREYDMLGMADPFKLEWTNTARKRYKWFIFNRNLYGRTLYAMQTRIWEPLKQRQAARKGDTQSQPHAIDPS